MPNRQSEISKAAVSRSVGQASLWAPEATGSLTAKGQCLQDRKPPCWLIVLCASILFSCAPAPVSSPQPSQPVIVTLTFDDGDADNFPAAARLQQYSLHATFYIPSGLVGRAGYMTWDQLQALQQAGNEIGGHSLDHMKLSGLDSPALRHEVCDDRTNLINHGFTPISFAYPFGNYDPNVKAMLKECGYAGARTIRGGPQVMPPSDPYGVLAFPYIVSDTDLGKLQRYINGTRSQGGGWVILTFHHVCDACDYFAVHPDVWNAFVPWLARQQSVHQLQVKTFGEVITGKP